MRERASWNSIEAEGGEGVSFNWTPAGFQVTSEKRHHQKLETQKIHKSVNSFIQKEQKFAAKK